MKIEVLLSSESNNIANKQHFDKFGGIAAGVCYMKDDLLQLMSQSDDQIAKRVLRTKNDGHHSVYDHSLVSLYLNDIPKALAMLLNNEKMYTTSEKSARYTRMKMDSQDELLYNEWKDIFKALIADKYAKDYPKFATPLTIDKLAQENARYLISVLTPVSMIYTISYRQLNYIYSFVNKMVNQKNKSVYILKIENDLKEFALQLEKTGLIDDLLIKGAEGRKFSLLKDDSRVFEYFGDVYATNYKASFAQVAQAQRHRTLAYNISLTKEPEFYIPPIIKSDYSLVKQWLKDCNDQSAKLPQGMLVDVAETGGLDNFILKLKERKCTRAQLEINNQTYKTLLKYVNNLQWINHPRAEELQAYTSGSRCTFVGYKCNSPCEFKPGIKEYREI